MRKWRLVIGEQEHPSFTLECYRLDIHPSGNGVTFWAEDGSFIQHIGTGGEMFVLWPLALPAEG